MKLNKHFTGKWLPIKTAPQNGTRILARIDGGACFICRYLSPFHWLRDPEWYIYSERPVDPVRKEYSRGKNPPLIVRPTEWYPLAHIDLDGDGTICCSRSSDVVIITLRNLSAVIGVIAMIRMITHILFGY